MDWLDPLPNKELPQPPLQEVSQPHPQFVAAKSLMLISSENFLYTSSYVKSENVLLIFEKTGKYLINIQCAVTPFTVRV